MFPTILFLSLVALTQSAFILSIKRNHEKTMKRKEVSALGSFQCIPVNFFLPYFPFSVPAKQSHHVFLVGKPLIWIGLENYWTGRGKSIGGGASERKERAN